MMSLLWTVLIISLSLILVSNVHNKTARLRESERGRELIQRFACGYYAPSSNEQFVYPLAECRVYRDLLVFAGSERTFEFFTVKSLVVGEFGRKYVTIENDQGMKIHIRLKGQEETRSFSQLVNSLPPK